MTTPQTYAITGVASGIGAELAQLLKSSGHRVIGFDLTDASDSVDRYIPLDLNDPVSIAQAATALDEPVDGLCNNAGVPPIPDAEVLTLQVNFLGQRDFTQRVFPRISAGGAIVNMASRAGHSWMDNIDQVKRLAAVSDSDALPDFVAREGIDATRCYNLSKEAMILWTQAMTEPLFAQDLRAVSLSPGGISTGILDDFHRAFGDKVARNIERTGRPGRPDEVAQIAAFVLSRAAYWMKGIDIPIDGGMGAFNLSDRLGLEVFLSGAPD
ncbi:MAG: coniferyl-alcohol dehydrogenase [Sulfitobacter sp.]